MNPTILLADDHPMFRQGLSALLKADRFSVVGEAEDGLGAVSMARNLRPEVAVLDVSMPTLNGIAAARQILEDTPGIRVILLTVYEEEAYVLEALHAGIRGYVLKAQAATDLVVAIHKVLRRGIYISPGVAPSAVEAWRAGKTSPADPLTAREREVLCLISDGKTTREIAAMLDISVKTADSHRTHLMQKLDIHETASLVRYAVTHGLIEA
ncbi:MAG: response regulator transcription factor [Gammaproteobacteria bacterium]|nr:response regulator transcription factor [Gammaproteobacteria bacterium]